MALNQQIQPLEDQISFLQEANANNTRGDGEEASAVKKRGTGPESHTPVSFSDLELRLQLSMARLQDSQILLEEADKENYNLSRRLFLIPFFFVLLYLPEGGE